jgi:hypothetical protein
LAAGRGAAEDVVSVLDELYHACHFAGAEEDATGFLRRALQTQERYLPASERSIPAAALDGDRAPLLGDASGAHVPKTLLEAALARADRARDLDAHTAERSRLLAAAGDVDGAAFAELNLAHLRRANGHLEAALEGYRAALGSFLEQGNRLGQALARLSLARLLAAAGDGDGSRAEALAAASLAEETGCRWILAQTHLARFEAAAASGDAAAQEAALAEASALVGEIGNVPQQAELDLVQAELALARGDRGEARERLAAFSSAPRSAQSAPQRLRARLVLAGSSGDEVTAEALTSEVLAQAERRRLRDLVWRAAWLRAQLRRDRGDTQSELMDLVTALDALRRLSEGLPAELRAAFLARPDCAAARSRFGQLRGEG